MILLDTGYFIALLEPRDQLHARALAWSRRLDESTLVTEYVICETLNYFAATGRRRHACELVKQIRSDADCTFVAASPELFELGFGLYETRRDQAWSLTDCISFGIMNRDGLHRALAFDHHFQQAGFQALLRDDP